ncbi:enoyl-CoA hydratase/isomerase family protein [Sphingopyxis sp. PET50]|uniref:enoyl-CoA hydratase/isomerase family protein n=1 Tax=Sphingopyxis sp. PET50 TaxID=2976533 RepID=UPI0021AE7EB2|nr:enoyl-CoA hydratase-related protein [Sphingopyxis sp. PET50]
MGQERDVVLYAVEGGVARITLNRPERLNASNGGLSRGLTAAFTRAGADPEVRVVLLAGAGRAFCAGADMQVLGELSDDPSAPNSGSGGLRYDGLMLLPKPVIAAIHGACAGIGLALACAADIRIAADDAVFVAPFANLGLCAEGGLAWSLSRLVGPGHAAEMLMSARRVAAEEAFAKGLVSRLLPREGFRDAALGYAAELAEGAPSSFALIKRQLRDADGETFEAARAKAAALTRETLHGPDFAEALAAKREG